MGYLPSYDLSISAIKQELVYGSNSLRALTQEAQLYDKAFVLDKMSSFRGWRLPPATITMTQNAGGIWDGCYYHDVWCDIQSYDPNFGYQDAWGGQFMTNTERGNNNGTFLTFGGGTVTMEVHGKYTVNVYNTFGPVGGPPCTGVYISITVNGIMYVCSQPVPGDYKTIAYSFTADPGNNYNIECNVNYGYIC